MGAIKQLWEKEREGIDWYEAYRIQKMEQEWHERELLKSINEANMLIPKPKKRFVVDGWDLETF